MTPTPDQLKAAEETYRLFEEKFGEKHHGPTVRWICSPEELKEFFADREAKARMEGGKKVVEAVEKRQKLMEELRSEDLYTGPKERLDNMLYGIGEGVRAARQAHAKAIMEGVPLQFSQAEMNGARYENEEDVGWNSCRPDKGSEEWEKEFDEKVNELRTANEYTEEPVDFGFRKVLRDERGNDNLITATDWGHVKSFIRTLLPRTRKESTEEAWKAGLEILRGSVTCEVESGGHCQDCDTIAAFIQAAKECGVNIEV